MPIGIYASIREVLRSRRGSVAIQIALLMTALIGMVALGTEITFVMFKHRQMQSAADSAAQSTATAIAKSYPADFRVEADAVAAEAGFVNGANGVTIAVNQPPATGPHTADSAAVEVIITQPQTLALVTLFRSGLFNLKVRAVALLGGAGGYCVLQLRSASLTGVAINNGAVVNLTACGLAVNATGSSALSVTGGAVLNAQSVSVHGSASVTNGGKINATDGVKSSQPVVSDPYASVVKPSYSGCNFTNKSYGHSNSGRQYIGPSVPGGVVVYCNGLSFTNDAIVTINPGIYVINKGTFSVGGAVQLTGTGVTVFLTSSTGSSYAKVAIGNGSTVTLTAPTTGAMAGLVFFGDRNAPTGTTSDFGGGALLNITGTVYFPSQTVTFTNGIANPSGCTQLIAGVVQFKGGANFKNNCGGTGVLPIGAGSTPQLVE